MKNEKLHFFEKHKIKIAAVFASLLCLTSFHLTAEELSVEKASEYRKRLVVEAKKHIGAPYVYGAIGPDSFDCSGLIYYVAREANGTQLPRTSKALYTMAKQVSEKEKEPGDLLFFATTSSGAVSHVGIYIGNDQFISALSDGPNTGVILSSLKESYWKTRYLGAGQIYIPVKNKEDTSKKPIVAEKTPEQKDKPKKTDPSQDSKKVEIKLESLVFDTSAYFDWALINPDSFIPTFRGLDLNTNVRLSNLYLQPGLSFGVRWNYWMDIIQLPVNLSFTLNDYMRFYVGPVIAFTDGVMKESKKEVSPSIFPGTLGLSLTTPSFTSGDIKVQLAQDISYTVYNNPDNSAMNFFDSLCGGLVLFTGVRITFPITMFMNGK